MGFKDSGKMEYTNTGEAMFHGQEVAVLVSFHPDGRMLPVFIQIEDEEQQRMRLRIHKIYRILEDNRAGCPLIRYEIGLLVQGNVIRNELIYGIELHRWWLRS